LNTQDSSDLSKPSKLEKCLLLLQFFALNGPFQVLEAHKLYTKGMGIKEFRATLSFLKKEGLILKDEKIQNKSIFSVTRRGISVLSYFQMLPSQFQNIVEER
jgi:hypothetical protein